MKPVSKISLKIVLSAGLGLAVAASHAQPRLGERGMAPGAMGALPAAMPNQPMMMQEHAGVGMRGGMMDHGPGTTGMIGGPAGSMQHDDATRSDMGLVHELLFNHDAIKRTVFKLPHGIKTVTESEDPHVAKAIQAHVASMEKRLNEGRPFVMFSRTLPVLFENKDKIRTSVQYTDKGAIVNQSSDDTAVVSALQSHAAEVSDLARDGMVAMMRSARTNIH